MLIINIGLLRLNTFLTNQTVVFFLNRCVSKGITFDHCTRWSISNLPRYEGMAFDTIFPHHCDPNDISAYPAKFQQNRTNSKKVRVIKERTAVVLKKKFKMCNFHTFL